MVGELLSEKSIGTMQMLHGATCALLNSACKMGNFEGKGRARGMVSTFCCHFYNVYSY